MGVARVATKAGRRDKGRAEGSDARVLGGMGRGVREREKSGEWESGERGERRERMSSDTSRDYDRVHETIFEVK